MSTNAVAGNIASRKRGAQDLEVASTRKRQKSGSVATAINNASEDGSPDPTYQRHGVFRFLDLPGELRNHVYSYAVEHTYRCFPLTWPKYASSTTRTAHESCYKRAKRTTPARPIPYLPLTQVCFTIRKEFRPLFLSTHCFPLFALEGYLKAFYPAHPRKKDARARFDACMHPAGKLRIYIGREGIPSSDILRLLKHASRFPRFYITPVPAPHFTDDVTITALNVLLKNSNPLWLHWIRNHVIKQVRVSFSYNRKDGWLHIVVKDMWAEKWMKSSYPYTGLLEAREKLGLQQVPWRLAFGVDYS